MAEFTKEQLKQMDAVISNSTGGYQRAEAAAIASQIFGPATSPASNAVVANSAVLAAASPVGKAPSKIPVTTVAINPTTGMPYSASDLAAGASRWLNTVTPAGQIVNNGKAIYYDGLAGSVQLPAGVRPQVLIPSVNETVNGTASGGPVMRYNLPHDIANETNDKDQTRLSPGGALAFADGKPMLQWPTLAGMPAAEQAQVMAAGGNPQDILSLHAIDSGREIPDPVTKKMVPSTQPVAAMPAPPQLYAGTNGYVYVGDGTGGYKNVGALNPRLSPSEQYSLAAAAALASQPNGNVLNLGKANNQDVAKGRSTAQSLGGMPG